ncbi:MAG: hypothetical protein A2857_04945 [Candidatus Levybacteria bacterium RIFCSPHIGHO2_01_FULL_36_15]|nr:MAG: hypothetical protein A2857_04945 [Candidatus Levybacteria bacterium RIFCSPHIGHO2_01_FULL_36_15]
MRQILFFINTSIYFSGLIETGEMLNRESNFKPIFYFSVYYPLIHQDISVCQKENIDYILGFKNITSKIVTLNKNTFYKDNYRQTLKNLLLNLYGFFFIGLIYEFIDYYFEFKKVKKLIQSNKIGLVILGGDNISNSPIVVKICHNMKIPVIIIPNWMVSGYLEAAEAAYNNPMHDCKNLFNNITGNLFPKWAYKYKNKKLLKWPAFKIWIIKLFGLEPPLPWVLHSGYADKIFVESQGMYDCMIQEGLPKNEIILTGSLRNDNFFKILMNFNKSRKRLYKNLGFQNNLPLIICALPPNQLYGYGRSECEFRNYDSLVEFWIKSLARVRGYNIVISLHPSEDYEKMKYIEKWRVKIFQGVLSEIIPLCDIFVASISSTIQWAIACGKPVLNYDVYKYNYTEFAMVDGVITISKKNEFINYLKKLTGDKLFYDRIELYQKEHMKDWVVLDGKSQERMLKLFNKFINKN